MGASKYSGTFNGKEELITRLLAPLNAQVEGGMAITPDNPIADGDFVAMQAHGKALSKFGRRYDNTYCHVFASPTARFRKSPSTSIPNW